MDYWMLPRYKILTKLLILAFRQKSENPLSDSTGSARLILSQSCQGRIFDF